MGLFKQSGMSFETRNADTIIGADAYFQGTLTAKGSLKIEGKVDGSVTEAKIVTVGRGGRVNGDINCEVCYVCGEVNGNITAIDHVEAVAGARIEGDVSASGLVLEEGAYFNGRCRMEKTSGEAA